MEATNHGMVLSAFVRTTTSKLIMCAEHVIFTALTMGKTAFVIEATLATEINATLAMHHAELVQDQGPTNALNVSISAMCWIVDTAPKEIMEGSVQLELI